MEYGGSARLPGGVTKPTLKNSKTYSYTYNAQGQRVTSTYSHLFNTDSIASVDIGEVTAYTKIYSYDSFGRLISVSTTETLYGEGTVTSEIVFLYDQGSMVGMQYTSPTNGTNVYYYLRNLQGDVIGIYDTSGNLKVKYNYDAWGNCTVANETTDIALANVNPIRYRGYYYDRETRLYYLNARYYSPEWRRFISPDAAEYIDPETPNGLNLYAYCYNDPVNFADPSGHLAITLSALVAIVLGVAGATAGGIIAYNAAKDNGAEGWDLLGWTVLGIVGGGIIGGASGYGIGALITKATGVLGFSIFKGHVFTITQTIVLGHYGYTEVAKSLGYGFYEIADDLYNSLNNAQRWAMNSQYLNDCAKLGANFLVEANRVISPFYKGNISYLYHEIQYLLEKGYMWLEDLSALVK